MDELRPETQEDNVRRTQPHYCDANERIQMRMDSRERVFGERGIVEAEPVVYQSKHQYQEIQR